LPVFSYTFRDSGGNSDDDGRDLRRLLSATPSIVLADSAVASRLLLYNRLGQSAPEVDANALTIGLTDVSYNELLRRAKGYLDGESFDALKEYVDRSTIRVPVYNLAAEISYDVLTESLDASSDTERVWLNVASQRHGFPILRDDGTLSIVERDGFAEYPQILTDQSFHKLLQNAWFGSDGGAAKYAETIRKALPLSNATPTGPELFLASTSRALFSDSRLERLMEGILKDPRLRFTLHWREFEEIVAELLRAEGYEDVVLGTGSRDGGVDIVGSYRTPHGKITVAVQCKRYERRHTVEPNDVRSLWGVITDDRFGQGILITTSTFQPMAKAFAARTKGILVLEDGEDFVARLRSLRG